jgi:hypothetical protein
VHRSEPGKFGAVFYHPAQNVTLVLLKLNGTAISRNEHRIIGTIKTIRKKIKPFARKIRKNSKKLMTKGHI